MTASANARSLPRIDADFTDRLHQQGWTARPGPALSASLQTGSDDPFDLPVNLHPANHRVV